MADKAWYTVTVFGPDKKRAELDVYANNRIHAEGRAEGFAARKWGGRWIAGLVKGPRASP